MTAAELEIIIKAEVASAIANMGKVDKAVNKTGQNIEKVAKKGGKDFTGLSRVIQDLPYGFNAISNNLTQLLPAAGAAGLAFSAIVSAITFATNGTGAWTRGLGANKTATQDAANAAKEYAAALQKTYEAAGQNVAQVAKLVQISQLETTTRGQQLTIVKQLKEVNQEYFKDLKVEGNTIIGLTAAYEGYFNGILKVARAKGAEESISKLTTKLLAAKDATLGIDSGFTNLNLNAKQTAAFLAGTTGTPFERFQQAAKKTSDILAKMAPTFEDMAYLVSITGLSEREINYRLGDRRVLLTEQAQLQAQILSNSKLIAQVEQGSISTTNEKVKKEKELAEIRANAFIKGRNKFDNLIGIETGDNINAQIQKQLDASPPLKFPPFDFDKTDLAKKVADLAATLNGLVQNAIIGISDSLGAALAGKGNIFDSLLGILGESFQALGKYIITGTTLIASVSEALTAALGGAGGIGFGLAIGAALIVLGSVMKNIPKFASGGVVTQPTLLLAGERGPERITPLGYEGAAGNMMTGAVQFVIRGQDLYGTLNRFNQGNRNIN